MRTDNAADQIMESRLEMIRMFQFISILTQRLGDGSIEHNVCAGD